MVGDVRHVMRMDEEGRGRWGGREGLLIHLKETRDRQIEEIGFYFDEAIRLEIVDLI